MAKKVVRAGKLDIGEDSLTLASAMSLPEEITMLRKRVKEQDKEIRCPKKKPNGIIKEEQEVVKSDDLLKREFLFRYSIGKMHYRYHRDPGIQWEIVCVCNSVYQRGLLPNPARAPYPTKHEQCWRTLS